VYSQGRKKIARKAAKHAKKKFFFALFAPMREFWLTLE
jgi:hypothetical protein